MDWDGTTVFGNARSKRYALVLENATVKKVFVEPDNTGLKGMFCFSIEGNCGLMVGDVDRDDG